MQFAVGDVDKGWDIAPQIQQGMEFDSALVLAEFCPRKHGKAQIDGGGVQGVDRALQFHSEAVVRVQLAGRLDERASKIGVDPPIANFVGIGQVVAGYR